MKKKWMSGLLAVALALTLCFSGVETAFAASSTSIEKAWKAAGDYLYTEAVTTPSYGSTGGEWVMYGLAESGYEMSAAYIREYKESVEKAVKEGNGVLSTRKYTEYSRVIIAYAALGLDPTDICGYNMVEKLVDLDAVMWQGVNGPIFALRALDAGNYQIPSVSGIDNVTTRQKLVDYLLACQLADGGWNLYFAASGDEAKDRESQSGLKGDVDLTAMALEALAPYYKQTKVKSAIDRGVTFLSTEQNQDGTYSSWGTVNSESCAQVVSALSNLGINPNTDSRFKKNGKSVVDGLLTFYDGESGGFRHVNTDVSGYTATVNLMATEQAYYALAQYFQAVPGKATLQTVTSTKSGTLKVTWRAVSGADGYQIKTARNSGFTTSVKNVYVTGSGTKTKSKTITGLTKGKTCYVKVRAYRVINGKKVYGLYSTSKRVVVKK